MSTFSIMLDMFEFDGYANVALIKVQLISTMLKDTGRQYIEIVMCKLLEKNEISLFLTKLFYIQTRNALIVVKLLSTLVTNTLWY